MVFFIRLRQNTLSAIVLWRTAGMNGEANRVEARQSEDGLATTQFRWIPRRLRRGASLNTRLRFTNSPHNLNLWRFSKILNFKRLRTPMH